VARNGDDHKISHNIDYTVPASRQSLSASGVCRKNAEECRQLAAKAIQPAYKDTWLKLAEHWLKLAEGHHERYADLARGS
jgi:hypothetical protein